MPLFWNILISKLALWVLWGSITAKLVDVADAGYYAKNNQGKFG